MRKADAAIVSTRYGCHFTHALDFQCAWTNFVIALLQFAADPEAYGVTHTTSQTPRLARTLSVISSTESETSESSSGSSEVFYPCRLSQRRPKKVKSERPVRSVRSLVVPVLAAGAAVVVTRLNKAR